MKILVFSSLYPNAKQPSHGIFVENRLRQLLSYESEVEAKVVAPVPWFPSRSKIFGAYAQYAGVENFETRHGIDVSHPKYPVLPKIGMHLAPELMYRSVKRSVAKIRTEGFDFDLIDAHYFYPDGVVAMRIADDFSCPFVVTGRGTDLNLIPQYSGPRTKILEVSRKASHMMTVAGALKSYLVDMGVSESRVSVLRNGVDLAFFQPLSDRTGLREKLGFSDRPMLLSVGHLIERKGHHLIIEAMQNLPEFDLTVVGDGPEQSMLHELVGKHELQSRVRFAGRLDQKKLRENYQAADALILASSREGWANVLLEAMACGTPVVATPVDGTPEVVASPDGGRLTGARSSESIVSAIRQLFEKLPSRDATRRYAEGFSWDDTSRGQLEIFRAAIKEAASRSDLAS